MGKSANWQICKSVKDAVGTSRLVGSQRATLTMKCVMCHSADIEEKTVDEIFWVEEDAVVVPCHVLVCNNCGERYYDRRMVRRLEQIERQLESKTLALETVGQVLKLAAQPELAPSICEPPPDYDTEPPEPSDTGSPGAQP